MEREPYRLKDFVFSGSTETLENILKSNDVLFLIDADGIIINSPKKILGNFENKYGIKVHPSTIDRWDILSEIAKINGLPEDVVATANDEWFQPEPLLASQPYLHIRPLLKRLINRYGLENNYILTSRNPGLRDCTVEWFNRHFPELSNNILIRKDVSLDGGDFKVEEITKRARDHKWVVFIDDALNFAKQVVESNIENVFVINVPLGVTRPDFEGKNLLVLGRYPMGLQSMYPLYHLFDRSHNLYGKP
ncbi:MAG: hypothetical protein ABIJ85_02070 [bacterium]